MAAEYCINKTVRVWNLGHADFCNEDFNKCKYAVKFGKQEYCGYCPPRVTLHQVIRGQAGCLWCKYATKKLSCELCTECLSNTARTNFKDERGVPDDLHA